MLSYKFSKKIRDSPEFDQTSEMEPISMLLYCEGAN